MGWLVSSDRAERGDNRLGLIWVVYGSILSAAAHPDDRICPRYVIQILKHLPREEIGVSRKIIHKRSIATRVNIRIISRVVCHKRKLNGKRLIGCIHKSLPWSRNIGRRDPYRMGDIRLEGYIRHCKWKKSHNSNQTCKRSHFIHGCWRLPPCYKRLLQ